MVFVETVKIVLLCIAAAVVYGILHDQVTARVCVEYFTIGHPPVFNTDSPTLLALGWGSSQPSGWAFCWAYLPHSFQGSARGPSTMPPACSVQCAA